MFYNNLDDLLAFDEQQKSPAVKLVDEELYSLIENAIETNMLLDDHGSDADTMISHLTLLETAFGKAIDMVGSEDYCDEEKACAIKLAFHGIGVQLDKDQLLAELAGTGVSTDVKDYDPDPGKVGKDTQGKEGSIDGNPPGWFEKLKRAAIAMYDKIAKALRKFYAERLSQSGRQMNQIKKIVENLPKEDKNGKFTAKLQWLITKGGMLGFVLKPNEMAKQVNDIGKAMTAIASGAMASSIEEIAGMRTEADYNAYTTKYKAMMKRLLDNLPESMWNWSEVRMGIEFVEQGSDMGEFKTKAANALVYKAELPHNHFPAKYWETVFNAALVASTDIVKLHTTRSKDQPMVDAAKKAVKDLDDSPVAKQATRAVRTVVTHYNVLLRYSEKAWTRTIADILAIYRGWSK